MYLNSSNETVNEVKSAISTNVDTRLCIKQYEVNLKSTENNFLAYTWLCNNQYEFNLKVN